MPSDISARRPAAFSRGPAAGPDDEQTADALLDDLGRRMLKRRVDALKSLPTFPESVVRINQIITQDGPKESLRKIAEAIETDPV
ncbi:hypothetical protein, partial [Undibacterium luofuense]|uniref:hypothetical protein n=1 Tax=Undibacterium luofuense TaxID=2828733 RepID=UPI0030ED334C